MQSLFSVSPSFAKNSPSFSPVTLPGRVARRRLRVRRGGRGGRCHSGRLGRGGNGGCGRRARTRIRTGRRVFEVGDGAGDVGELKAVRGQDDFNDLHGVPNLLAEVAGQ